MMLLVILVIAAALPAFLAWAAITLTEREVVNYSPAGIEGRPPSFMHTILVYTLLGPLAGSLPWLLIGLTAMLKDGGGPLLMFVVFGYAFGFLPAALTGLAQAWFGRFFRQRHGIWLSRLASSVSGLLLGGCFTWLAGMMLGKSGGSLFFSAHGMLAGGVLGGLFPVAGRPERTD